LYKFVDWFVINVSIKGHLLSEKKQEDEFLDIIGTNLLRVFLFAIHSYLLTDFTPLPLPLSKCGLELVYNVNIVYGNLKHENTQDYAQKPQIVRSWVLLKDYFPLALSWKQGSEGRGCDQLFSAINT
jgi:hypothetical protein